MENKEVLTDDENLLKIIQKYHLIDDLNHSTLAVYGLNMVNAIRIAREFASLKVAEKENLFTERELEQAYAIGILNQKDITSDSLAEQLKVVIDTKKFELLKRTILSFREDG